MSDIEVLKSSIETLQGKMLPFIEAQKAEMKKYGQSSEETAAKIDKAGEQLDKLRQELATLATKSTELETEQKSRIEVLEGKIAAEVKAREEALLKEKEIRGGASGRKSLGESFVESLAFQRFVESKSQLGDTHTCDGVSILDFIGSETKTATQIGNSGGLIDRVRSADVYPGMERLTLRALMRDLPTPSPSGYYMEETLFAAAGGSGITQGGGVTSLGEITAVPETEWRTTEKTWTVKDVGTHIVVSRNLLEDAPQVRSRIDTRLVSACGWTVEQKMLVGDGSGNNLLGIMAAGSGKQSLAWSACPTGYNKIDAIRRAITKVAVKYFAASGVVITPEMWEEIEVLKGSDDHYLWVSVVDGGRPLLWRVPVVVTTAMTANHALVADFRNMAHVRTRRQVQIRAYEEVLAGTRQVMIAADERLAFVLEIPNLAVDLTFDAAPA